MRTLQQYTRAEKLMCQLKSQLEGQKARTREQITESWMGYSKINKGPDSKNTALPIKIQERPFNNIKEDFLRYKNFKTLVLYAQSDSIKELIKGDQEIQNELSLKIKNSISSVKNHKEYGKYTTYWSDDDCDKAWPYDWKDIYKETADKVIGSLLERELIYECIGSGIDQQEHKDLLLNMFVTCLGKEMTTNQTHTILKILETAGVTKQEIEISIENRKNI